MAKYDTALFKLDTDVNGCVLTFPQMKQFLELGFKYCTLC